MFNLSLCGWRVFTIGALRGLPFALLNQFWKHVWVFHQHQLLEGLASVKLKCTGWTFRHEVPTSNRLSFMAKTFGSPFFSSSGSRSTVLSFLVGGGVNKWAQLTIANNKETGEINLLDVHLWIWWTTKMTLEAGIAYCLVWRVDK